MYFKVCYHFENIFVFASGKHFDDPPLFNFPACERLSSRILNCKFKLWGGDAPIPDNGREADVFVAAAVCCCLC